MEYHSIVAKLKQDSAGAEAHTVTHWQWRGTLDGDAAGRGEERRRVAKFGEVRRLRLVEWVRKEEAKLLSTLL
jgi:hypothetical protein